jgi:hypothetical protein
VHARGQGTTPPERFGYQLLDEPQVNSAFNIEIMNALDRLVARVQAARRGSRVSWYKWEEAVIRADLPFFDALRAPAIQERNLTNIVNDIERVFSLICSDKAFLCRGNSGTTQQIHRKAHAASHRP